MKICDFYLINFLNYYKNVILIFEFFFNKKCKILSIKKQTKFICFITFLFSSAFFFFLL